MSVDVKEIAGRLTAPMRRTLMWMPEYPYARDWSEITSAFGPRGSFRTLVEPLIARGLLEKAPPDAGGWHYRLTPLGEQARAHLLATEPTA